MRAVLISIRPHWCQKIAQLIKTFELRKNAPQLKPPFKCYIYMSAGGKGGVEHGDPTGDLPDAIIKDGFQKVIGEFICDFIEPVTRQNKKAISEAACVSLPNMYDYAGARGIYGLKAWHISDPTIYDTPKELCEFAARGECDVRNCKRCSYFDRGNGYNIEDDCAFDFLRDGYECHPVIRPPQSWCYVEE